MKECTPEDRQFRYNYFVIGADDDYIQTMYGELDELPNVHFHPYGLGSRNPILRAMFKLHWSAKVNAKIRLPLKRLWFSRMCRYDFKNENPVCYIFLGGQYIVANTELREYINKLNPENRIVIKYEDLIAKKHYTDFELVRNSADLLVTYDPEEARRYGIGLYARQMYSRLQEVTEPQEFRFDIYFLGNAKDRLPLLMAVYHKLMEDGIRCRFLLAGVPEEKREVLPGITYITGISYAENLKNIQDSKCILEICQNGSDACTMRYSEAVTYHRLLLTNSNIEHSTLFQPEIMIPFHTSEDICTLRLKKPIAYDAFRKCNVDTSPVGLLDYLEKHL